jgi:hypothetical protein
MKSYNAYLHDKNTHRSVAMLVIKADGYLTALAETQRLCEINHPNLYVGKVEAST